MAKPKLVAVPPPSEDAQAPSRPARPGLGAVWWLAALLVIAVVALAVQTRQVDDLESQVAGLGAELESTRSDLAGARADLSAYEARFDQVRDSVADLQARLESLGALVTADPAETPSP